MRICLFAWVAVSLLAAWGFAQNTSLVRVYEGHYIGEVVPTPRSARYFDEFITLIARGHKPEASLLLDARASELERVGAKEISAQAGYLLSSREKTNQLVLPIIRGRHVTSQTGVAIAVGTWSDDLIHDLAKTLGIQSPPSSPENYSITMKKSDGKWWIVIAGADERGTYYGAQSLLQLMTRRDGAVILRRASIIDGPAYRIRSHQFDGGFPNPQQAEFTLTWSEKFKLNQVGFGQAYDRPMQWRSLTPEEKTSTEYFCQRASAKGAIRAAFYAHPHRSKAKFNIRISDPKDMEALVNLCAFALERGAGGIMLRSDDIWPLAPEDQKRFGGHAPAHIFMVNQLDQQLRRRWPNLVFMFCPPHYTNATIRGRKGGIDYTQQIGREMSKNVLIVWTGPVTRSLVISDKDVDFVQKLIPGHKIVLWDNTVYAHRSRYGYDPRHPHYFLDTFATKYPDDFPQRVAGITYNWNMSNPLSLVGGINTADYMWNPRAYDPEESLRKALAIVAGKDCVDDLLALRDAYYEIFDGSTTGIGLSAATKVVKAEKEMDKRLQTLQMHCDNKPFLKVLESRVQTIRRRMKSFRAVLDIAKTIESSVLLDLPFNAKQWTVSARDAWDVRFNRGLLLLSYPGRTKSEAGSFGQAACAIHVPPSPTERYYLVFSCHDDYSANGTPPHAWPGYHYKQVLVDGKVVWEDDVEGAEPVQVEAAHVVDVTDALRGKKSVTVVCRAFDKRGVANMGTRISFGDIRLAAGPFRLVSVQGEIPDSKSVRIQGATTFFVRFISRRSKTRQALFFKGPPTEYFSFIGKDGNVVAGVYADRKEVSIASRKPLARDGREHWIAFVVGNGNMKLFGDGEQLETGTFKGHIGQSRRNLLLGHYPEERQPIRGAVREFAIARRALTIDDLDKLAAGKFPEKQLAAHWRLPETGPYEVKNLAEGVACTIYRIYAAGGQEP